MSVWPRSSTQALQSPGLEVAGGVGSGVCARAQVWQEWRGSLGGGAHAWEEWWGGACSDSGVLTWGDSKPCWGLRGAGGGALRSWRSGRVPCEPSERKLLVG